MTAAPLRPSRLTRPFALSLLLQIPVTVLLLFLLLIATVFGPLFYIIAIAAAFWCIRKRYYFQAFICIFGVPLSASLFAIIGYLHGSATFHYMGLPSMAFLNVDPEYRCEQVTGGCIVHDTEWLTDDPHNLTLQFLIHTFGPQRASAPALIRQKPKPIVLSLRPNRFPSNPSLLTDSPLATPASAFRTDSAVACSTTGSKSTPLPKCASKALIKQSWDPSPA